MYAKTHLMARTEEPTTGYQFYIRNFYSKRKNIILYYLIFHQDTQHYVSPQHISTKLVFVDFSVCSSLTSLISFFPNSLIVSSSFPYQCNPNSNNHADANYSCQNRGPLQYMSKSGYKWIMQNSILYVYKTLHIDVCDDCPSVLFQQE